MKMRIKEWVEKDNKKTKATTHHMGFLYLFILFFKNEDLEKKKVFVQVIWNTNITTSNFDTLHYLVSFSLGLNSNLGWNMD
jgi:hypothetical protein